jgi:ElaB/YqjD/DUF883 family membrane-anchored ribosome-binding protein
MNSEELEGKINNGIGKVEQGAAEDAVGRAKEAIGKTARKAREVVGSATDQAADAYQTVRKRAEEVAGTVDPFVKEQPYIAVMLAGIAGLILGALFAGGGAKVIYIKPARD